MRKLAYYLTALTSMMFLVSIAVYAQDQPLNEIEVRGVYSIPSGESRFSTSGSSGTTIDFSRDFDFRNELGFDLRFTRASTNRKHKLLAEYGATSWNRTTSLSRSFTFRGETYVANLNATADLKLRTFRAMYAYRWGNEKVRFGPMADMGVIDVRLKVSGSTNNGERTTEGSLTKFAATVGYDLDYEPSSKVNIFNTLGGIVFMGQRFFRTEGGLRYFPTRHFGMSGGYRYERYKVVDGDYFITVQSHGPFVGIVFRF